MADEPPETHPGAADGAQRLLARAAAADARARARLKAAIADIFLPTDTRSDDRTRAGIDAAMRALVATVEEELRREGERLLRERGASELAEALAASAAPVTARLWQAGLPRDPEFMRELIARVRLDLLAELLPITAGGDAESASLLPRLTEDPDPIVAANAIAVLAADGRRRDRDGNGTDLPAELHHKLVWWIAAALREPHASRTDVAVLDRALADAALRNLSTHDESERSEAAAARLAAALDPAPADYADLLVEALGDRRVALFVAILAQGSGVPYQAAREIVLDTGGERLWLVCRALDLPRDAIAQIGLRLAEADPRRDLERFADELDHVAAIPAGTARAAVAPLRLPPDYRAALEALRGTDA